jgi:hypothetical protein
MSNLTTSAESKPNIVITQALEDKGYRCGASHSPPRSMNQTCSKLIAVQVPQELDINDIMNVLGSKAEKSEVEDLRQNKTNKSDSSN